MSATHCVIQHSILVPVTIFCGFLDCVFKRILNPVFISDTKFVSQFLYWTGFTAYWNYLNILNERILYASYMNLFYWWRCFCWLCEIGAHMFFYDEFVAWYDYQEATVDSHAKK